MTPRMRARRQDGASAVEFALLFTFVLAPLLFGMLQYGMYFYATNAASSAAREALRRAVVGDCQNDTQVTTLVNEHTQGARQEDGTGEINYLESDSDAEATTPEVGDRVEIIVNIKAIGIGGFIPQPNGGNITRAVTGRIEDLTPLSATACQ